MWLDGVCTSTRRPNEMVSTCTSTLKHFKYKMNCQSGRFRAEGFDDKRFNHNSTANPHLIEMCSRTKNTEPEEVPPRNKPNLQLLKSTKISRHTNYPRRGLHSIKDTKSGHLQLRCTLIANLSLFHALPCCLHNSRGDTVCVTVRSWAPIFHVTLSSLLSAAGNADGGAAVGHREFELLDAAHVVFACEALLVAVSVLCDVLLRHFAESLTDLLDNFEATCLAHLFGREIGVAPSSIPITIRRFRIPRHYAIVALGDA